jgi:hypothetical protein
VTSGRVSIAVGAVLLVALPGCGPRPTGPLAGRPDRASITTSPRRTSSTVDRGALSAAGRVATRYALAARSWTPASYGTHYREQLRLSAGSFRAALLRAAPTREQLAAYRADGARVNAKLVAATELQRTPTLARYQLVLDERSVAAGQSVTGRSTYIVELQRGGGGWRAVAFSVQP